MLKAEQNYKDAKKSLDEAINNKRRVRKKDKKVYAEAVKMADRKEALWESAEKRVRKAKRLVKIHIAWLKSAKNKTWVNTKEVGGVPFTKYQVWADGSGINLTEDSDISNYKGDFSEGGKYFVIFIHNGYHDGITKIKGNERIIRGEDLLKYAQLIPTYKRKMPILFVSCGAADTRFHIKTILAFKQKVKAPRENVILQDDGGLRAKGGKAITWIEHSLKQAETINKEKKYY